MRNILAVILAVAVMLPLAGCGVPTVLAVGLAVAGHQRAMDAAIIQKQKIGEMQWCMIDPTGPRLDSAVCENTYNYLNQTVGIATTTAIAAQREAYYMKLAHK